MLRGNNDSIDLLNNFFASVFYIKKVWVHPGNCKEQNEGIELKLTANKIKVGEYHFYELI